MFWVDFIQKFAVLQIDWNLAQGYIIICLLQFLTLFFNIFFIQLFGENLSQILIFSKLTESRSSGAYCYMLITLIYNL